MTIALDTEYSGIGLQEKVVAIESFSKITRDRPTSLFVRVIEDRVSRDFGLIVRSGIDIHTVESSSSISHFLVAM